MTLIATLLVPALAAFVVDTAWVALFRAQPVGRLEVLRDGSALFQFRSRCGTFSIYPKERRLLLGGRDGPRQLALDRIRGLEYRMNQSHALLQELFFGFDLTDFLEDYRDTVDWFSVAVLTHEGERIPLYLSGEYQQREFLMTWYIDLQAGLLRALGLLADVPARSREAMELLRAKLGSPPLL